MGIAAGITAAAAAASAGSAIAGGGGGGGGSGPQQPNAGSAAGQLFGFLNPVGNALSGIGIQGANYLPIGALNINTPGFANTITQNNGQLDLSLSQYPNGFQSSLTNIMQSLGDLASGAGAAGNSFLKNVLGTDLTGGGSAPILAPLNQIEMGRQKAVSDVEGALAARGLQGSSFATNSLNSIDSTFSQAASQAALQLSNQLFGNQLQTLQSQGNFLNQQSNLANTELSRELQQLQTEGTIGATLQGALTRNSSTLAELAARATAGQAAALTNFGQTLGNQLNGILGGGSGGLIGSIGSGIGSLLGLGSGVPQSVMDQLTQIQQSALGNWNGADQGGITALGQPTVGLDGTMLPGAFG